MIFFDTETTGLIKPDVLTMDLQPFITEIYMVKLTDDLEFVDEIDTLIKPPIPISEEITKITGISDETVKDAQPFISIYPRLVEVCLGEESIVAHNAEFDCGVLRYELARCGYEFQFPWPPNRICTVEKSFPIKNKRLRLKQLHELATGREHEGQHRAKADVHALLNVYVYLKELGLV